MGPCGETLPLSPYAESVTVGVRSKISRAADAHATGDALHHRGDLHGIMRAEPLVQHEVGVTAFIGDAFNEVVGQAGHVRPGTIGSHADDLQAPQRHLGVTGVVDDERKGAFKALVELHGRHRIDGFVPVAKFLLKNGYIRRVLAAERIGPDEDLHLGSGRRGTGNPNSPGHHGAKRQDEN